MLIYFMIQSVKILFQVTNEFTAQKIKTADLVAFTEKIFNELLHFLCSGSSFDPQQQTEKCI